MSNDNELDNLRTAILSLQSGLMAVLESLEILSKKSDKDAEFAQQIQIIKQAVQQLPNITSLKESSSIEPEPDNQAPDNQAPDNQAPDAIADESVDPSTD